MGARLLSLQDVATARAFHAAGWWQDTSLYNQLAYWASRRPDSVALIDTAGSVSWRVLRAWTDSYAALLAGVGLRSGDRVAIWAPSRLESAVVVLACSRMGYVAVPSLHRDHTPEGVIQVLRRTSAAAFVHEAGYGVNPANVDLAAALAECDHLRHVAILHPLSPDQGEATPRFGGLLSDPVAHPDLAGGHDPDRVVYLAFTSGTTGAPKGVMHSDNTLLANARSVVADYGFDTNTVTYTLSPMSHNMGTVSLAITLVCGGALVLHGPRDGQRLLSRIRETGATYLVGVPTHGIDLVAQLTPNEPLGRVRHFQLAGAPVPARLATELMNRGITVQNCYGMTENCSFLYTRPNDPLTVITNSCGRCAAGMEITIFDPKDSDRPLAPGEIGEIGVRGPSMMLGYFDDQGATEASYNRARWFLSGDLGMLDAGGNYRIVGRKKDLIIRGGRNIHPAAVETLIMRHPAISKAAAFPVPDPRLGERMCVAVSLQPGKGLTGDELLIHLHEHALSHHDMPEYFIVLKDFPLTASGKILKRELTAMVTDGRLTPASVRWRQPATARPVT